MLGRILDRLERIVFFVGDSILAGPKVMLYMATAFVLAGMVCFIYASSDVVYEYDHKLRAMFTDYSLGFLAVAGVALVVWFLLGMYLTIPWRDDED